MDGTGFTRADYEEEAEVWPENWPAYELFRFLDTQWSAGFNRPTGLNYPVLFNLLDRQGLEGPEWWQMFNDIRHMEAAALAAMQNTKPD